jgi:hypothetical protein
MRQYNPSPNMNDAARLNYSGSFATVRDAEERRSGFPRYDS